LEARFKKENSTTRNISSGKEEGKEKERDKMISGSGLTLLSSTSLKKKPAKKC